MAWCSVKTRGQLYHNNNNNNNNNKNEERRTKRTEKEGWRKEGRKEGR
jgi:hypothetical protein